MLPQKAAAIAEKQKNIFMGKEGDLMKKQAERMADTFGMETDAPKVLNLPKHLENLVQIQQE